MFPRIKDLREDNDLSQSDIARILNISQRAYSHYETGDHGLPVEVLIALSKYYKVSTDYILGLSNKKQG